MWSWIKRWFDPITTSKIFVLSQSQILPTLTQFIDPQNIPKKYGGTLEFKSGDIPNLDPDLREYLTMSPGEDIERFLLTAPVRWVPQGDLDGEMAAIGVGSINGKQRQEHLATLHGLATRVATHKDRLSRANTQQSYAASISPSTSTGRPVSRPNPQSKLSHTINASTIQPSASTSNPSETPGIDVATTKEEPAPAGTALPPVLNSTVQNGAPPEKITMPPPPVELGRQKTEYMTPPTDPAEAKALA